MNYYALLGIDENATDEAIKKAFRKKLKTHHPDIHFSKSKNIALESNNTTHENLVDIINAYNVLSNPVRRRHYDGRNTTHFKSNGFYSNSMVFEGRSKKIFDYEKFLLSRKNIWEYKIKFFVYDLVFCNGERATGVYELILYENKLADLKKSLSYMDYFDCMFLLAECYQNKVGSIHANKAMRLFLEIGEMECKKPYFKSYMEEVADRVLRLIDNYKNSLNQRVLCQLLNNMTAWTITKKQIKSAAKLRKDLNIE